MSWMTIPVFGGLLKVKPKRQMRYPETNGDVPLVNFGFFVISYWNNRIIEREKRLGGPPQD